MRSERVRKFLFVFEHFWGFIEILFAAVIALDAEAAFEGRARSDGVGLGKGDSMPEEKVLPKMIPMVLAEHHPTIVAIDPHLFPLHFLPLGYSGNSRRHSSLGTCAAASTCARKRTACAGGNRLLFSRCFLTLRVVRMGGLEGKENAQSSNCDAYGW
jgi:hypothetical protein